MPVDAGGGDRAAVAVGVRRRPHRPGRAPSGRFSAALGVYRRRVAISQWKQRVLPALAGAVRVRATSPDNGHPGRVWRQGSIDGTARRCPPDRLSSIRGSAASFGAACRSVPPAARRRSSGNAAARSDFRRNRAALDTIQRVAEAKAGGTGTPLLAAGEDGPAALLESSVTSFDRQAPRLGPVLTGRRAAESPPRFQ